MVKQVFEDEGKVYNYLKIIRKVEPRITPKGDRVTRVEVECTLCGTIKEVTWSKVKSGHTKSCGCVAFGRRKDITGERVGKLTATRCLGIKKYGSVLWEFSCDCGGKKELTVSQYNSAHTTSCGCSTHEGRYLDLSGKIFGRLTVIEPIGKNKAGQYRWKCECSCGNGHEVIGTQLVEGKSKSCGCLNRESIAERSRTHGMSKSPEYGAWKNAIARCCDSNNKKYSDYGERGIKVCERWLGNADTGFANFMEDMGPCDGLTLDRIDVDGDYTPENCRWVDRFTQSYNTRQHVTNTSGKTGVSENKDGTWQAYISFKGTRYSLGEYRTFDEAVSARENAEIKYYGEKKGH